MAERRMGGRGTERAEKQKFLQEEFLKHPGTPGQCDSLAYVPHTDNTTPLLLVPAFCRAP